MYETLGKVELRGGEEVAAGVVTGPDLAWAERVEQLLGHKGDVWRWQNSQAIRRELGVDMRFYLLHRDGDPFANMMTAEHFGVGHFGHVWTNPADRRKGAASLLMGLQIAHFRERGGRALFLGTEYDSPAYHIYASRGFTGIEEESGNMEYYAASRESFEAEYFASGPTEIQAAAWRHWPATAALFLGGYPGTVRCAPMGLFGRSSTEHAMLEVIHESEGRQEEGEVTPKCSVMMQSDSHAAAGLAAWGSHPLWPGTGIADVYCHPDFWERGARELLASLQMPQFERLLAYSDEGCAAKAQVLEETGFRQVGRFERRLAIDRAGRQSATVLEWERS